MALKPTKVDRPMRPDSETERNQPLLSAIARWVKELAAEAWSVVLLKMARCLTACARQILAQTLSTSLPLVRRIYAFDHATKA